jgi:hypothetical protein
MHNNGPVLTRDAARSFWCGFLVVRVFLHATSICARGVFWLSGSVVVSQDGSRACSTG